MSDHVYKTIEITGSAASSVDDAIRNGITKAAQTIRHLDWYEVTSIRGHIEDGAPQHVQVTMKLGFRLE